jgi:hypothetical protein
MQYVVGVIILAALLASPAGHWILAFLLVFS